MGSFSTPCFGKHDGVETVKKMILLSPAQNKKGEGFTLTSETIPKSKN